MKTQNQKEDDSSEGPHHAKEVEATGEIMQKAEARKKFLRSVIKTIPSQFSALRWAYLSTRRCGVYARLDPSHPWLYECATLSRLPRL